MNLRVVKVFGMKKGNRKITRRENYLVGHATWEKMWLSDDIFPMCLWLSSYNLGYQIL